MKLFGVGTIVGLRKGITSCAALNKQLLKCVLTVPESWRKSAPFLMFMAVVTVGADKA